MAFWGTEVKPGKPYTHSSKDGRGRLRISQATLAIGSATTKSLVQCNVGDKSPILLCALLPDKTESLQLDLEFDEAEDVMFSVIGPRGVYLTGYYLGDNRHIHMQDDTESYGEDIANSETQESNHNSDEDEYDDSFINDDEPEPLTPSPVPSSTDEDEEQYKKVNVKGGLKRLKKKYQSIVSDDDMSVPENDDEDSFPISPLCNNNKPVASGKKTKKEKTVELDKETKNINEKLQNGDSQVLDSKDEANVHLANGKTEGKGDEPDTSMAEVVQESKQNSKDEANVYLANGKTEGKGDEPDTSMAEVVQESKPKSKKKKQESYKGDKTSQNEANTNNVNDKPSLEVVTTEVPINEVKTKKKKKDHVKKSNAVKADDDMSVPEIDDEDSFPILPLCNNNTPVASGKKTKKEKTVALDKETKSNNEKLQNGDSQVHDSKDEANVHLANGKTEGEGDQENTSMAEVVQESKPISKKKKQDSSKGEVAKQNEDTTNNVNDKFALEIVTTEGSAQVPINEVKTKKKKKDHVKKSNAVKADDDQKASDMVVDHDVLTSAEVVPEDNVKPKKKRKARAEVNTDATCNNLLVGNNKQEDDPQPIDKIFGNDSKQLDDGNQSEEKKVKKKKQKTSKTHEANENKNMEEVEKEGNKKTLSNGLVIEDLVKGKSKRKVAAPGKKVKVQYVVKLKENEKVIDSNEKSPYTFRLGDKEVIEGLNVGLEGMRVGDKRRLTIPPSMSLGYKGTGENIPPNSWLVYDVEMCSIN